MPQVQAFLEIGTGAGYALAEALLSGRCKRAVGSDISQ
jgi:methylase of polypeptide subunit release factors